MPPILVGLGCFEVRRSPAIDVLYLHFRWLPLTYPPTKFISSQGNPYSSAKIARKSGKSLPKFSKKLTGEKPTFHLLPRYTSTQPLPIFLVELLKLPAKQNDYTVLVPKLKQAVKPSNISGISQCKYWHLALGSAVPVISGNISL